MHSELSEAIRLLARELGEIRENNEHSLLKRMDQHLHKIMATQAELVTQAKAQADTIAKIGLETDKLIQNVKDLQDAVNNQTNASPELVEAMGAVSTQLQQLDDKVPDATAPAA